jgi:hypothetical protein
MAAKMPTGERPKKNSGLAQFIAETKSNKLTPAEARVAAGRYSDMVDKIPGKYRNLDNTGVVLGKAIRATQKNPKQKNSKPDKKTSLIQDITNRYRVTAREARDIVTAVGTLGTAIGSPSKTASTVKAAKNLGTQIKEAAKVGKTGTTSMQYQPTSSSAKQVKKAKASNKGVAGKLSPGVVKVKFQEKKSTKR